jgi:hypothetical protein
VNHGERFVWVSFDPDCLQTTCAFRFVLGHGSQYRLASFPARPQYRLPRVYLSHVARRNRLALGKLRSLAEQSSVYRRRTWTKKVRTVHLQVRKRKRVQIRVRRERSRGVNFTGRPAGSEQSGSGSALQPP